MSATEAAEKMVKSACLTYKQPGERAALRCALGDAAGLCDAIAKDIAAEHRVRGNRISKRGLELAVTIERCGNAIWAMREKIEV